MMPSKSAFRWQLPLLLLIILAAASARAQNNFDLSLLNPGEIMVNLNAMEQTEVDQDTLHANLYYSAQGRDRVALQDEVNSMMAEVLELLADSDIEYSTQQYRVYPIQPNRPTRNSLENVDWRAQQGVQLESQDTGALLDLVGELQAMGMTMNGLNYSLSAARQEEVADSLMTTALEKLQNRAQATADAMGKSNAEIVEITMNSNSNGGFYRGAAMAMSTAAAEDFSTPVAEPGRSTVIFNVSARVILLP